MGAFSVTMEVSGVNFTLDPDPSSSASSFSIRETDTDDPKETSSQSVCIDLENFSGSLRVISCSNPCTTTSGRSKSALAVAVSNDGQFNSRETPATSDLRCDSNRRYSAQSEASAEPQPKNNDEAKVREDIIGSCSSDVAKSIPEHSPNSNQAPREPSVVSFVGENTCNEELQEAALQSADQTDNDSNPSHGVSRGLDSRRGGMIAKTDSERATLLGREGGSASNAGNAVPDANGELHMICTRPRVDTSDLEKVLREHISQASKRDPFGRYPLHVLAENEALAASMPTEEMIRFLKELLDAYPEAVLAKDIDGQLPFVATIAEWVDNVHTSQEDSVEYSFHGVDSPATNSQLQNFHEATPSVRVFNYTFPRDVVIPTHVLWSFRMLSVAMDHLTPSPGTALWRRRALSGNLRFSMAKQIASSVPFICKTILLVADEDEADAIFNTSLIRTMLLYPELVGYWLVAMIRSNRSRAVDFLERVSKVAVNDLVGRKRGFNKDEINNFVMRRKRVFDAVAGLEGLVPSMLALNAASIERAASTRVITYVLDRAVNDPFSLGFMLFDLILEIILVISYRIYVDGENLVANVVTGCGWLSLTISAYFLLREILTAISMIATSTTMFNKFLRDFWTINDILSMTLTIISCACKFNGVNAPALFAFTIGFLWLKVLGTLKTLNMYLATLVLALVEVSEIHIRNRVLSVV